MILEIIKFIESEDWEKMADLNLDNLIDKIKTGASKASKEAVKITKNAATAVETKTRQLKLQHSLHSLEERLENHFSAIGESVYKSFRSDEEQEDFSELFGKIDALTEEIAELKNRIENMKNQ